MFYTAVKGVDLFWQILDWLTLYKIKSGNQL